MRMCPSRRQVLAAAGLGAGAMVLGGCAAEEEELVAPAGEALIDLAELAVGESASVQTSTGATVLLTRTGEAEAVAFSAVCTHQGCTVEVPAADAEEAECPCHGSRYDLTTGEVTARPADEPLAQVSVEVDGGQVRTARGAPSTV